MNHYVIFFAGAELAQHPPLPGFGDDGSGLIPVFRLKQGFPRHGQQFCTFHAKIATFHMLNHKVKFGPMPIEQKTKNWALNPCPFKEPMHSLQRLDGNGGGRPREMLDDPSLDTPGDNPWVRDRKYRERLARVRRQS